MPISLNGHAFTCIHTHSSKKVISKKRKTRSVCQHNHPEVWVQYYGVGSPFTFTWVFKEEPGLNTCTHPLLQVEVEHTHSWYKRPFIQAKESLELQKEHVQMFKIFCLCVFVPDMILRPSARIISLLSTRVLRIQVTLVGALSASSTTNMWPNFAAFTCSHKNTHFQSHSMPPNIYKIHKMIQLVQTRQRETTRERKRERLTKGESSYVIIPFSTEG